MPYLLAEWDQHRILENRGIFRTHKEDTLASLILRRPSFALDASVAQDYLLFGHIRTAMLIAGRGVCGPHGRHVES